MLPLNTAGETPPSFFLLELPSVPCKCRGSWFDSVSSSIPFSFFFFFKPGFFFWIQLQRYNHSESTSESYILGILQSTIIIVFPFTIPAQYTPLHPPHTSTIAFTLSINDVTDDAYTPRGKCCKSRKCVQLSKAFFFGTVLNIRSPAISYLRWLKIRNPLTYLLRLTPRCNTLIASTTQKSDLASVYNFSYCVYTHLLDFDQTFTLLAAKHSLCTCKLWCGSCATQISQEVCRQVEVVPLNKKMKVGMGIPEKGTLAMIGLIGNLHVKWSRRRYLFRVVLGMEPRDNKR